MAISRSSIEPSVARNAARAAAAADHARRGLSASPEAVIWIGTAGSMLTAIIVTLLVTDHRLALMIAAVGAAAHGLGIAVVHLFPKWGPLSDPFPGGGLGAATWTAVSAEIGGAALLAVTAWAMLRDRSLDRALSVYEIEHGAFTDAEFDQSQETLGAPPNS